MEEKNVIEPPVEKKKEGFFNRYAGKNRFKKKIENEENEVKEEKVEKVETKVEEKEEKTGGFTKKYRRRFFHHKNEN